MIRRRLYPFHSLWNEIDSMMAEMETRLGESIVPANLFSNQIMPAIKGECRVDVMDHQDEAVVVADLPGVEKEDVKIRLINPSTLEIACNREKSVEEGDKDSDYYMRERTYGSMKRIVSLPYDVEENATSATFKNGVLEIHFKKSEHETGGIIPIE